MAYPRTRVQIWIHIHESSIFKFQVSDPWIHTRIRFTHPYPCNIDIRLSRTRQQQCISHKYGPSPMQVTPDPDTSIFGLVCRFRVQIARFVYEIPVTTVTHRPGRFHGFTCTVPCLPKARVD